MANRANREVVERLVTGRPGDWLLVAGDVAERIADIRSTLATLTERFECVIWAPGNHELWTPPHDEVALRGEERYLHLVDICRDLGVLTPEDAYAVWTGPGGPAVVAPLLVLYDYSFLPPGTADAGEALERAYRSNVVCTDEMLLHPDPYPTRADWCRARVAYSEDRLTNRPAGLPTVLINHFPLVRHPTGMLRHPEFAQWCGTEATADWHRRFRAVAVVYGHLHIPRTTWHDGVRFDEVSLGYPREWQQRPPSAPLRQILPPGPARAW
jgi:3',5'-cyclic AMP phosphodiesterase CpdA